MATVFDNTSELFWSKQALVLPPDQTKIHLLFKQAEGRCVVFNNEKLAEILMQAVYVIPLWAFQKVTVSPLMVAFTRDFLQTARYPGLVPPNFQTPSRDMPIISGVCVHLTGGGRWRGKVPKEKAVGLQKSNILRMITPGTG